METINLKVTKKVIAQSKVTRNQEQMAIVSASLNVQALLSTCNKNKRLKVRIASGIELTVGDTSAIWQAHNKETTDFSNLYQLLAKYPDKVFVFPIDVL